MRKTLDLVLRRDDHKHDGIGAIFLDVATSEEEVRAVLARYLGSSVTLQSFERTETSLRARVEVPAFESEAENLVRLGRSLLEKGRHRAASDMFSEALRLDPLNVDALKAWAQYEFEQERYGQAHASWVRASEVHGYDGEILRGLANTALAQGRQPSAMRYLELALRLNPDDVPAGRLLEQLRHQIELRFEEGKDPKGS